MQKENITITRNQIGLWVSALGGIALLIGVIGYIWQGGFSSFIIGSFIVGAVGLILWAVVTPDEFRGFVRGRQTRYTTGAIFGTLLLVGILALAYVIIARAVITLDMTQDQRYTLSSETRALLNRVNRPIQITGFYSPAALRQRAIDDQYYRQYEVETNSLITRLYIDPIEQPAVARNFGADIDGQVFISYLNADGSVDFSSLARVPRSDFQERDMTQALSRLLIAGSLTVYFEQSHGELDPSDTSQQGISGINNGIRESGIITFPLFLTELAQTGGSIPADAAAVVLARPTTDFNEQEIGVLDRYLRQGGALMILTDVLYNADAFLRQDSLFNQYLWANFGLRALDAVIVDPASSSGSALDIISASVFVDNQIVQRIDQENAPTLFRLARAIEVNSNPPPDTPNGRAIMSSEQSYGETNLAALGQTNTFQFDAGQDIPGPLTSVAWANNRATGAKILMIGDSDFATNGLVLTSGNAILFTDGLSWLTGFSDQINFAPQAFQTTPVIFVSSEQLDLIAFITVFLMPGALVAAGTGIWLRRMRA